MTSEYSTLVFDLDGTLSDPSLGITRCMNHALENHGFPQVSAEHVATQIGPPLDDAFRCFVPSADPVQIDSLIQTYRERYAQVGYSENRLYDGVAEAIQQLNKAGIRLGVCTSKRRDFAESILELFGLLPHFAFVDGGDVGINKSRQLSDLLACQRIDRDAVMIGDRSVDIRAAQSNDLASVGVLWGFGSPGELAEANPTYTVGKINELVALVG